MTLIELIKKIEKLNKINKELELDEKKLVIEVNDYYLSYEVKTMKDLNKIIKDYEWKEEEKEVLNTKELKKVGKDEYQLNETYYIGQYDSRIKLSIELR